MNDVEAQYMGNVPLFFQLNATMANSTEAPLNITEYSTTEGPLASTIASITSAAMFNGTTDSILNDATVPNVVTVAPAKIDDVFYIYVWAAAILGCIIVTSGRFVYYLFLTLLKSVFQG